MFLKQYAFIFILFLVVIFGCQKTDDKALQEKSKQEILQTEKEFEIMGIIAPEKIFTLSKILTGKAFYRFQALS